MKTEVERYTERYLKQSQIDDNEWTPGTYVTHHHGIRWNTKKRTIITFFLIFFFRLEPFSKRTDAQKKTTSSQNGYIKHNMYEMTFLFSFFVTIRIKTQCLTPTGTKKSAKISHKDAENILTKLDVSFI